MVAVRTAVVQAEGAAHIAAAVVHIVVVAGRTEVVVHTEVAVHIEAVETVHTVAALVAYHILPSAAGPSKHPIDCYIHRNYLVACWTQPLLQGLLS